MQYLKRKLHFCFLKSVAYNRVPALFFMKFYDSDLIYLSLDIFLFTEVLPVLLMKVIFRTFFESSDMCRLLTMSSAWWYLMGDPRMRWGRKPKHLKMAKKWKQGFNMLLNWNKFVPHIEKLDRLGTEDEVILDEKTSSRGEPTDRVSLLIAGKCCRRSILL